MYDEPSESCGLGARLRTAFLGEYLRHILPIDEDFGHKAIGDISSMRDDADWSAAEQFLQSLFGGLATWLVQFRRVDASESDALGPNQKMYRESTPPQSA